MTKGVIYANAGKKCLARLIVSLHSLRKHFAGPVTVFQEGVAEPELKDICKELDVDVVEYPPNEYNNYVKKCAVNMKATYDCNMFLDADTLVTGGIDEYLDWVEEYGLVFTNFSDWSPTSRIMKKRIESWLPIYPDAVTTALKYPAALNTGTYGFKRGHAALKAWLNTSIEGQRIGVPLTDELAAQLIAQFYPHYVAPPKYGYSVKFGPEIHKVEDARIIHYHGRKHIGSTECHDLWKAEFMEAHARWGLQPWDDGQIARIMSVVEYEMLKGSPKKAAKEDDVTYVTAVDANYLDKLKANLGSWTKAEHILKHPMVVFVDASSLSVDDVDFLPDNAKIVLWNPPSEWSQRERMLSAFVLGIPDHVTTKYFIKIDADVTSSGSAPAWSDDWKDYAVVSHRWGYTKPKGGEWDKHWLNMLDEWWAGKTKDAPMFPDELEPMARHSHARIASFYCFHETAKVSELAAMCGDRMPIPSHDTLLWYVATRKNWPMSRRNLKRMGLTP